MKCRNLVVVVAGLALVASACSESRVGSTTSVPESTIGVATDLNTTDGPQVDECETSTESGSCAAMSDEWGYVLFAPLGSTTTYLIDREGNVAHSWESDYRPGNSVYLLDDGDLLHTGSIPSEVFATGGSGGVIQRINWDGEVEWELSFADADQHLHHDIELLPDGNILAIAWEFRSAEETVAAGLDLETIPSGNAQGMSFDQILELDPTTGEVVWEWHVWDHLVQEYDVSLPNYGAVTESPERVDLNYPQKFDFTHINSIDYDAESDRILLSVHSFSEIWVIDHATTADEAAGPAGDLLYRWGNPEAYGGDGERILYAQHDAEWIGDGLPGAGNILIFNNGDRRLRPSSTIEEITLPDGGVTADAEIVWSHDTGVFAQNVSGSQRLPSGNTLITSGPTGTLHEVTPGGETVWTYVNPFATERPGDETTNAVFRADWYPASFLVETPEGATDLGVEAAGSARGSYAIVDTGQVVCYDEVRSIACPEDGEAFFGQDGNFDGSRSGFVDNGNGTVTDATTGLMWQQDPGDKMSYYEAAAGADPFELGGYDDWRLPSIKELYSLIDFSGLDPSGCETVDDCAATPFIDTDFFAFEYGDTDAGERVIDSQWATSTVYVGTTMFGNETMFGVNFADGRIKGYGVTSPRGDDKEFFVIYVRDNPDYGVNEFVDNGDETVSDVSTGLIWQQSDSGIGMDWSEALDYCTVLDTGDHDDWRLPDAKELQSIVDYGRSPSTSDSAAIDRVFSAAEIISEGGSDYGFYWTGTTHVSLRGGTAAVYIAFGEALGWMQNPQTGEYTLLDVHGAGAQRSDPKAGDAAQFPYGRGPQGDVIRIDNLVRCVRAGAP